MKSRTVLTFLVALFMIVQSNTTYAQKLSKALDGWTLLGTREVDYTIDRDVVSLKESKVNITGLKFIVKNGTLNMHRATVHFSNGDSQEIQFDEEVNAANDGRVWDLKGNSRKIEKVTFWYDTVNNSKAKSIVQVWGK
ncbi:MAG: DUF2541 family protein [Cyclobacteriaceae bacterium]|nr:DUF2541 family protein [Cyclobacteriaceae bacterium]